jgi:hypothetical protein
LHIYYICVIIKLINNLEEMKMKAIKIVMTKCKRCGKTIAKTDRPLYGSEASKEKYGDICQNCMPKDEYFEMLGEQGRRIQDSIGGGKK